MATASSSSARAESPSASTSADCAQDAPLPPSRPASLSSYTPVLIKDFAYPPESPLFAPEFDFHHNSDEWGGGVEGDDEETEGWHDEDEQENNGWGPSVSGGFTGWAGAAKLANRLSAVETSELERNFVYEDDEDEDVEDYEPVEKAGQALVPGLYRATYPFNAEGDAEMSLTEGQVVRVIGRGGGVGWAVVQVENDKESPERIPDKAEAAPPPRAHALVPESYLELVQED